MLLHISMSFRKTQVNGSKEGEIRSSSRDASSLEVNSNGKVYSQQPEVDIQASHDEVIVRVSCPLDSHPALGVIRALKDSQFTVVDSKLTAANDTVFHTFVIKSQGSDQLTKEKLMAVFSHESNSLQQLSPVG